MPKKNPSTTKPVSTPGKPGPIPRARDDIDEWEPALSDKPAKEHVTEDTKTKPAALPRYAGTIPDCCADVREMARLLLWLRDNGYVPQGPITINGCTVVVRDTQVPETTLTLPGPADIADVYDAYGGELLRRAEAEAGGGTADHDPALPE